MLGSPRPKSGISPALASVLALSRSVGIQSFRRALVSETRSPPHGGGRAADLKFCAPEPVPGRRRRPGRLRTDNNQLTLEERARTVTDETKKATKVRPSSPEPFAPSEGGAAGIRGALPRRENGGGAEHLGHRFRGEDLVERPGIVLDASRYPGSPSRPRHGTRIDPPRSVSKSAHEHHAARPVQGLLEPASGRIFTLTRSVEGIQGPLHRGRQEPVGRPPPRRRHPRGYISIDSSQPRPDLRHLRRRRSSSWTARSPPSTEREGDATPPGAAASAPSPPPPRHGAAAPPRPDLAFLRVRGRELRRHQLEAPGSATRFMLPFVERRLVRTIGGFDTFACSRAQVDPAKTLQLLHGARDRADQVVT